jgi:hypothetical protein
MIVYKAKLQFMNKVDYSLNVSKMIINNNELVNELVIKKIKFKQYQMDVKNIKCIFKWWSMHDSMFPTDGYLDHQIL